MTADITYLEDDGVTVAQLETVEEAREQRERARDIAAWLESELAEKDRRIAAALALAERLPCSKPPLSCRRCDILRALAGES